jgi:endoglucanase
MTTAAPAEEPAFIKERSVNRSVFPHALRGARLVALPFLFVCALYGQTGYWHTSGANILDANNKPVRIAGVNWYGFETTDEVAHGLWAQDYKVVLNTIKSNGYNVVRIPFSNQMVESPVVPSNITYNNGTGPVNTDLKNLNSLQILDKVIAYAGQIGLRIILDNHRSEAGNSAEGSGLWYTSAYPETAWINDWTALTQRYLNNSTVVGMDLRNEPHASVCWGCGSSTSDWRLAAQRAGNAVLQANSNLLIFVEGIDCYNGDCDWWGGNLEGAQSNPVVLNVANRLVYSAHDYGPNLYGQSWFNGFTSYSSLVGVWTKYWAYLSLNGIAPVWVGEFGTTNNTSDIQNSAAGSQGQWFQSMVTFLHNNPALNWTYWALNGEDSYALLDSNYDGTPASALKQQMLASIQAPGSGGGGGGSTCTSAPSQPGGLNANAVSSSQINLSWNTVTPPSNCSITYNVYASQSPGVTATSGNRIATGLTSPSYQHTGLAASTPYYYVVTAVDSVGESIASTQATATTQSAGPQVPQPPTSLNANTQGSSQINLTWNPSPTSGVTYNVYSSTTANFTPSVSNRIATGVGSTSYPNSGLSPSTTYYYRVTAVNSAGESTPTGQANATTQPAGGGGGTGSSCHVTYLVNTQWNVGFNTTLAIQNTGATPITSWKLTWTWGGNQAIYQSWNSNFTQSGQSVTLTNASWNAQIAPGQSASGLGFNASYSGSNPPPAAFYVNGTLCK